MPILALCNYEIDKHKYDTFKYVRKVEDANVFFLTESLRQHKLDNGLQTDDVNLAYTNFVSSFRISYNHHCPVEKVVIKHTCKTKPWYTNGFKMRVVRRMFYTEDFSGTELTSVGIKGLKVN